MNQADGGLAVSASGSLEPDIRHTAGANLGHTESRGLLSHVATSSRPDQSDAARRTTASVPYESGGGGAIPAFRSSQQHRVSHWDIVRNHLNKRVIAKSVGLGRRRQVHLNIFCVQIASTSAPTKTSC